LIKILLFCSILLFFRVLAAVTRRIVLRGIRSGTNTSQLVNNMVLGLATRGMMFFGFLLALSQLGVELGPLLTGLGIVGFIVGFALQDSLANFAAGIMILVYRPYDVDDLIEAGTVFGTVSHMSLVSTTILTLDNQTLIVPNAKIWGDVIKNVATQHNRRVDLEVHVRHNEDVDRVEALLNEILASNPRVLAEPEPNVRLHKILESSLLLIVRPWVATVDYWDTYWELTREIERRFSAEGIALPRPQQDVHIVRGGSES
jgi:small conductance mechanosensitive channel